MSEERKDQQPRHDRLEYESPQAMRLTSVHSGAGDCYPEGSSDVDMCYGPGNTAGATTGCVWNGNTASGQCWFPGNTAGATCTPTGSGYS